MAFDIYLDPNDSDPYKPDETSPLSGSSHCSSSSLVVSALRVLANDIECEDGIANACVEEAADRIEELVEERDMLRNAISGIRDAVLNERFQLAGAGLDCDQVNAVLGIIDDHVTLDD